MAHANSEDGRIGSADHGDLAATLSRLARSLQSEPDEATTLEAIVHTAVDNIEGAEFGGISLVERQNIRTVAATSGLVKAVDQAQYEYQEGPCLETIRRHHTYRTDDVRAETRWPDFAQAAVDAGVVSILSFRLFTVQDTLGALNLYSTRTSAFSERSAAEGELFASHAAIALRGSQKEGQLRTAVEHRDLIGMAKGILMEREDVDPDSAFALLVSASQSTNIKVLEVARWLVTERAERARHRRR